MLWRVIGAWLSSMWLVICAAWLMARDGYQTVAKEDWESILLFALIVAFAPLTVIGFLAFVLVESMPVRHVLTRRSTAICKCGTNPLMNAAVSASLGSNAAVTAALSFA